MPPELQGEAGPPSAWPEVDAALKEARDAIKHWQQIRSTLDGAEARMVKLVGHAHTIVDAAQKSVATDPDASVELGIQYLGIVSPVPGHVLGAHDPH